MRVIWNSGGQEVGALQLKQFQYKSKNQCYNEVSVYLVPDKFNYHLMHGHL